MTIVLNEHEWAKEMIISRSLGKKPFETLSRVAKYYIDKNYSKKDVRRMLEAFLIQCDPTASLPKWSDTIDHALQRALKYDAIQIDYLEITKPEMDRIQSLDGVQLQRLAFTLLCLSKYWKAVNPHSDYWVNNKDCDIMHIANINTSIKRQSMMYYKLKEEGLIKFSKKVDNTNVRICFVEEGEVVLRISDFRNLGYQYLKYLGKPYYECKNCGLVSKDSRKGTKGRPPVYCKACARDMYIQNSVNSVMRQRERKREATVSV